jgi:hypothetical protein
VLARRSISLLAVVALLVAGCGGGNGKDGGTDTHGTATLSTTAVGPGAAKEISGPFAGKLTQAGLAPFRIGVQINPNGTGLVAYTGIDCAGHWTLERRAGPNYTFFEEITSGSGGKCKGSGTVHLLQTRGGTIRYRFEGGGVTSTGFLVPASVHALLSVFREAGVNLAAGQNHAN